MSGVVKQDEPSLGGLHTQAEADWERRRLVVEAEQECRDKLKA
jgi:hypothetical protein